MIVLNGKELNIRK